MRALRASSVVRWVELLREVGFTGPQAEALIKLVQDMYEEMNGERDLNANE